NTSNSKRVTELFQICRADLRGLERRQRLLRRRIQFDHDIHRMAYAFDQIQDARDVDLSLPQRTIPCEMLAAVEVLEMHVMHQRQEILDYFRRVRAALLKLPDVRREL